MGGVRLASVALLLVLAAGCRAGADSAATVKTAAGPTSTTGRVTAETGSGIPTTGMSEAGGSDRVGVGGARSGSTAGRSVTFGAPGAGIVAILGAGPAVWSRSGR